MVRGGNNSLDGPSVFSSHSEDAARSPPRTDDLAGTLKVPLSAAARGDISTWEKRGRF
jgi:hypothetical protein